MLLRWTLPVIVCNADSALSGPASTAEFVMCYCALLNIVKLCTNTMVAVLTATLRAELWNVETVVPVLHVATYILICQSDFCLASTTSRHALLVLYR